MLQSLNIYCGNNTCSKIYFPQKPNFPLVNLTNVQYTQFLSLYSLIQVIDIYQEQSVHGNEETGMVCGHHRAFILGKINNK